MGNNIGNHSCLDVLLRVRDGEEVHQRDVAFQVRVLDNALEEDGQGPHAQLDEVVLLPRREGLLLREGGDEDADVARAEGGAEPQKVTIAPSHVVPVRTGGVKERDESKPLLICHYSAFARSTCKNGGVKERDESKPLLIYMSL